MSEHSVRIIQVGDILCHPKADALEIILVGGWQAVVKKGQFNPGDPAIYIEPDYVVPTVTEEFAFLDRHGEKKPHRLRAVRLRGELSFGLLIPVPDWISPFYTIGDDVMAAMEITRYEPKMRFQQRPDDGAPAPMLPLPLSKFDLENVQKYADEFVEGEYVFATEKIHGANARFVFWDGDIHVGSRNLWLKPPPEDATKQSWWWTAYKLYPGLAAYTRANPGHVIYGEVYGDVQSLTYGCAPGTVKFAAFALYDATSGRWFDFNDLRARMVTAAVPVVPIIYAGPYHKSIFDLAEADSVVGGGHLCEGLVVVPLKERHSRNLGRVALKYISRRYWLSNRD
jgi:RNA ligase (TIGR02306 family)